MTTLPATETVVLDKHFVEYARSVARLSDGDSIATRNENAIKLQTAIGETAYYLITMRNLPLSQFNVDREDYQRRVDGSVARVIVKAVANTRSNAEHLLADKAQANRTLPAGHERFYVLTNVLLTNDAIDAIVEREDAIPQKVHVQFCGWLPVESLRTGDVVSYRHNSQYKQRIADENRTVESFMRVLYGPGTRPESYMAPIGQHLDAEGRTKMLCHDMLTRHQRKRRVTGTLLDLGTSTENKKLRTEENE